MLAGEINPFCWICGLVKSPYELSEGHNALGDYGAASTIPVPSNFDETDVSSLIIVDTDSNKDGECDIRYPVTHILYILKTVIIIWGTWDIEMISTDKLCMIVEQ